MNKVSFTFNSANGSIGPPNSAVANLYFDLGQGAYVDIASSNLTNQGASYISSFLGSLELRSNVSGGLSYTYYYAGTTSNSPIYLYNRPRNNNIIPQIATNGASPVYLSSTYIGQYTLILSFEEQN